MSVEPDLSARGLRAAFDAPAPFTVGLEEELMLLDPETLDLAPVAADVLERLDGDPRFKAELPRSQVEIVTRPHERLGDALAELAIGRRDLAAVATGLARPAAAGVHPFTAPAGDVNDTGRYAEAVREYGPVARLQLVSSLQVHVAVGGAERTLAVYNALRGYLPELAALAANAPFFAGADTGMASVRPKIGELLPRQGVPPALPSWDAFAEIMSWAEGTGAFAAPRYWWWELRPHPSFGTLEIRVPDAQTGLGEAAAVAATAHALVVWLAGRVDDGERLDAAPTWMIEENRWSAARHGAAGTMAALDGERVERTSSRLERLLDQLVPVAQRLGSAAELARARELLAQSGAERQREAARAGGVRGVAASLAERFGEEPG